MKLENMLSFEFIKLDLMAKLIKPEQDDHAMGWYNYGIAVVFHQFRAS